MNAPTKSLLIYIAKCVTGAAVVFAAAEMFNYRDFSWCVISVLMVLTPDSQDAIPYALMRIKANALGSSAGVLCLLLGAPNVFTICLAVTVTIILCYWFRTMDGSRSALAAVIIIMMHEAGANMWDISMRRVFAVSLGCVLALVVTIVFHQRFPVAAKTVAVLSTPPEQE